MHFIMFWSCMGGLANWYHREKASTGKNFWITLLTTHPWLGEMGGDTLIAKVSRQGSGRI